MLTCLLMDGNDLSWLLSVLKQLLRPCVEINAPPHFPHLLLERMLVNKGGGLCPMPNAQVKTPSGSLQTVLTPRN